MKGRLRHIRGVPIFYVDMGTLSTGDQVSLMLQTRLLIGAHGGGLAYVALLPSDRGRCGLVEIFAHGLQRCKIPDYEYYAMWNNVSYKSVFHGKMPRGACKWQRRWDVHIDVQRLNNTLYKTWDSLNVNV